MQAIPLVRANVVRPVLDLLERTGAATGPLLTRARPLLHDPTALLPLRVGGAIFDEAERLTGWSDIGLRVGAAVPILAFGDWGPILCRCATVADFVEALASMTRRFNSGHCIWAVRRGEEVWLQQRLSSHLVEGRRAAAELTLMLILDGIRLAAGPTWRPREIHLEWSPPPHAEQFAALAEQRTCFEQPCTAIVFPRRVLARRYPAPLGDAHGTERAPVPSGSFEGSMRQVIASLVQLGAPDLAAAAEAAHASERSLQRRLARCGLSFSRLVEEARFEAARRLLTERSTKIVEVSSQLGYSDSANFTRAFRRWSGATPQAFRRSATAAQSRPGLRPRGASARRPPTAASPAASPPGSPPGSPGRAGRPRPRPPRATAGATRSA